MSLKDDIKEVPSWVWLGGAAAAGVLLFLHARAGGAAPAAGAAPLTSGNGQMAPSDLGSASTQGDTAQTMPQPAPPPLTGYTFGQYLQTLMQGPDAFPRQGVQNPNGFTLQQQQQAFADFNQVGAQFAQYLADPTQQAAYVAWWQQGQQFGADGSLAGNQSAWQQWLQAGQAFLPQFDALGNPVAPGQGLAQGFTQPPGTGSSNLPAAGAGGGGFLVHQAAPPPVGAMNDYFSLVGPHNPSLYGTYPHG